MTINADPLISGRFLGATIEHAGQHNERMILQAIRTHGPVTRSDLAAMTGLTAATINNITNRLLDDGMLARAGQRRGGRGQPATRLVIAPDAAFSIGLNIDRDHLTMVAVNFAGEVRARVSREIAFPMPEDVRSFFDQGIATLMAQTGLAADTIAGIGIALPDDIGTVPMPGRPDEYARWTSVNIASLIDALPHIPILVENDAAAAAIGETHFGRGQQLSNFLYLLVTHSLGGGVVVNGRYDRGAHGRSGEIGFMRVPDGNGGSIPLHHILSRSGLAQALMSAGVPPSDDGLPDLADTASKRVADQWVERCADALVQPMIAVGCLLDPAMVLIGGRLPLPLIEQIAARTSALLKACGGDYPVLVPIAPAMLAEDAAAIGAALLPFTHLRPSDPPRSDREDSAEDP